MSVVKTPTSSLTASELLVNRLWYRTIANIKRLFYYGGTPEASTERSSPIIKLPQDLVELIISYFIYDTPTLLACSMTCYSWYIATVSHLHHSLTTDYPISCETDRKYMWPRPLRKSYELGLLPLVKQFRIRMKPWDGPEFTPEWLDGYTLHYFSALTNLQELGIDNLQVFRFMPEIQRCFGHFSPTLRFLALREPSGSCRQILYFIGLFPNLQDLKLHYYRPTDEKESTADATLVPLSTPPLRGWLTLTCFTKVNLIKGMIALFGGLRFRCMDLFKVKCVRLLLDACENTLETLRLYPTDEYADNRALLRDFNLSQNKSLRTLETTAGSVYAADAASDFFMTVLSSITSPARVDFVIIYRDREVIANRLHRLPCELGPTCFSRFRLLMPTNHAEGFQLSQIEVLQDVQNIRKFRLVLCADVSDDLVDYTINSLEHIVNVQTAKGGLDSLCRPLVISERRMVRTRPRDYVVGWSKTWGTVTSAL